MKFTKVAKLQDRLGTHEIALAVSQSIQDAMDASYSHVERADPGHRTSYCDLGTRVFLDALCGYQGASVNNRNVWGGDPYGADSMFRRFNARSMHHSLMISDAFIPTPMKLASALEDGCVVVIFSAKYNGQVHPENRYFGHVSTVVGLASYDGEFLVWDTGGTGANCKRRLITLSKTLNTYLYKDECRAFAVKPMTEGGEDE